MNEKIYRIDDKKDRDMAFVMLQMIQIHQLLMLTHLGAHLAYSYPCSGG